MSEPFPLEQLRELTSDNQHTLALWFAARAAKMPTEFVALCADVACEAQLAGQVSDALNVRYLRLSKEMFRTLRVRDPAFAEKVKMCF